MASDLASWDAKCKVLQQLGRDDKPTGKSGNCVTRMYARTGWWPLVRESENWEKAIGQFSIGNGKQANVQSSVDADMSQELGADVKIRKVVLAAFRGHFLVKAEQLKKEYDVKRQRKKSAVPCTVNGKGFCKAEDLTVVKDNDERIAQKAEAKV